MFQDQLLLALIRSRNEAADDVLVDALRIGNDAERARVLDALIQRKASRGLAGAITLFDRLPEFLQQRIVRDISQFQQALRDAGRSDDSSTRVAAMRLIGVSRQGRLTYVLSENLHDPSDAVSRAACEAMVALARWVASETRRLQGIDFRLPTPEIADSNAARAHSSNTEPQSAIGSGQSAIPEPPPAALAYTTLMDQRPEIEAAIGRALDVHRGKHGQELLRAAMLLVDSPASRTFQILATPKHAGQTPLTRRLQLVPAAEHVDAFLLGASHGHLRSSFANTFAHIVEAPTLDALLRKTHWLKDHALALCMHQVGRGAWWTEADLLRDIERRRPEESAKIAEWIGASGNHDTLQDERLEKIRQSAEGSYIARLRLLRVAARRKRSASVALLCTFLNDPDERLARMAAREVLRRRPPDFENMLLKLLMSAPDSVRRVVGRAIGQAGFEHFWNRFDRLPKPTRKQAGKAMFKLLTDAPSRLQRRLLNGPVDQRLKALQMVQELELAQSLREPIVQLCLDGDPRIRSKAVLVAGEIPNMTPDVLIDRLLNDADARVRANTIEVLETRTDQRFVPVLTERARSASNRERANAIRALSRMRVSTISGQLATMLRDNRPEHRVSAMWVLRQIGWWQLIGEVGRLAKADENIRVRRYALALLKGIAELAGQQENAKAG